MDDPGASATRPDSAALFERLNGRGWKCALGGEVYFRCAFPLGPPVGVGYRLEVTTRAPGLRMWVNGTAAAPDEGSRQG